MNPIVTHELHMPSSRKLQVAFRLPMALLERLDRHAKRLATQHPGLVFTRVDVVTTLLTQALDQIEGTDKQRKDHR